MMVASAYPNYRQSKMRWLPAVPEHWNEQRAKTFFREVDERSKTGQEELLSVSHLTGVTPRSQKKVTMFKAESYVGSKLCRPGDIVINTLWAWMAALGASRHVGIVSPAYGVYRPHRADSFNPAYLDYLLRTRAYVAEYIGRSTGIRSSRLRLYPNQFLDIVLIQPPRPEQDQIVTYLRAQDAHIARFIKAKRDLIKLLTEQKLRIIDHAVTRGLDASVALKPSGIEWLGEVPEHWEALRLRRLVKDSIKNGVGESARYFREDWPRYIRITDISGPTSLKDSTKASLPPEVASRAILNPGDLLFAAVGATFGKSYLHVETEYPCCYAGFLVRVSPNKLATSEFLSIWAQSSVYWAQLRSQVIQATIQNFSASRYKDLVVPVPPVEEQKAICRWISDECQPLDDAITGAEEEIKLIREYRDRLIADVVTGQVDVRGWQPDPEDVVDDALLSALGDENEDVTEEEDGDGED